MFNFSTQNLTTLSIAAVASLLAVGCGDMDEQDYAYETANMKQMPSFRPAPDSTQLSLVESSDEESAIESALASTTLSATTAETAGPDSIVGANQFEEDGLHDHIVDPEPILAGAHVPAGPHGVIGEESDDKGGRLDAETFELDAPDDSAEALRTARDLGENDDEFEVDGDDNGDLDDEGDDDE